MTVADTTLQATVAPDRSSAELVIPAGCALDGLTRATCVAALQAVGVMVEDDVLRACDELLHQATSEADITGSRACRGVVAQSIAPVHGQNGQLEWLVDRPLPSGEARHYDRCAFIMVKRGQEIARIIAPTPHQDGRDVTGQPLPATPGQAVELQLDDTLSADSRGVLIAQADGAINPDDPTLRVHNVLQIDEYVDFSTGNIDFSGDVIIGKGVRDCFTVRATGSVTCDGVIEAATVHCLGDLVTRGMAGRDRGSAVTAGHLVARYLDNVTAQIGLDLRVERSIFNCDTTICGGIDSPRATIVGGRHVVTGAIRVNVVGSPANVPTELVVATVPRLDPFHHKLVALLSLLDERLIRLNQEAQLVLAAAKNSVANRQRAVALKHERQRCMAALHRGRTTLQRLKDRIEATRTVNITVGQMIYLGVIINVNGQNFRIRQDIKGPLTIDIDEAGHPSLRIAGGARARLATCTDARCAA